MVFKAFVKFNLFARWVDPQFDNDKLLQEAETEKNSSQRTEESSRKLHQEQHSQEVEVKVIMEVEDPVKVVVEQV